MNWPSHEGLKIFEKANTYVFAAPKIRERGYSPRSNEYVDREHLRKNIEAFIDDYCNRLRPMHQFLMASSSHSAFWVPLSS